MIRWIDEFMVPGLKCDRLGHEPRATTVLCYLYPSSNRYAGMADRAHETTLTCRRCHTTLDISMGRPQVLTSLSLDTAKWDELWKNGIVRFPG